MNTLRVVLFRHGPAGERDPARWPDDDLRPLSERGQARTAAAAWGLSRIAGSVRAIWTSPLARASQTAALLREPLGITRVHTVDALRPGGSWRDMVERLKQGRGAGGTLVLVGHEPDLGKLAGCLVFGAPKPLPLKKAGACAIEFEAAVDNGRGRLAWLLTPKVLRSLARRKVRMRAR